MESITRARLEYERGQRTATSAASIVLGGALNVRYPLGNSEFKTWPPANRVIASVAPYVRKQAYRLASRKHLASTVAGKQVTVEYQKRDQYGRIVGKVWLNGVDAVTSTVALAFPLG